jgi:hypothetical protein
VQLIHTCTATIAAPIIPSAAEAGTNPLNEFYIIRYLCPCMRDSYLQLINLPYNTLQLDRNLTAGCVFMTTVPISQGCGGPVILMRLRLREGKMMRFRVWFLFYGLYIVKLKKNIHYDAAPVPARKMMRLFVAPAPQHCHFQA